MSVCKYCDRQITWFVTCHRKLWVHTFSGYARCSTRDPESTTATPKEEA